jgi:hypothetical protein
MNAVMLSLLPDFDTVKLETANYDSAVISALQLPGLHRKVQVVQEVISGSGLRKI